MGFRDLLSARDIPARQKRKTARPGARSAARRPRGDTTGRGASEAVLPRSCLVQFPLSVRITANPCRCGLQLRGILNPTPGKCVTAVVPNERNEDPNITRSNIGKRLHLKPPPK